MAVGTALATREDVVSRATLERAKREIERIQQADMIKRKVERAQELAATKTREELEQTSAKTSIVRAVGHGIAGVAGGASTGGLRAVGKKFVPEHGAIVDAVIVGTAAVGGVVAGFTGQVWGVHAATGAVTPVVSDLVEWGISYAIGAGEYAEVAETDVETDANNVHDLNARRAVNKTL